MKRILPALLIALALVIGTGKPAWAVVGFQASVLGGVDSPNAGRSSATMASTQLSTLSRFLRLQGSFGLLFGSGYLEGEGGVGLEIYPISHFVSDRAAIHPFLQGVGTLGVGRLNGKSRLDAGAGYGAGVDFMLWKRAGFKLSVLQHVATETSMRYLFGILWQRE
jgi:hypothetical protein